MSVRRSVGPYVLCYFRRLKERILGASCTVYSALFSPQVVGFRCTDLHRFCYAHPTVLTSSNTSSPPLYFLPPAPSSLEAPRPRGSNPDSSISLELRKASEKNGPISHYLLVVVPEQDGHTKTSVNPDEFTLDDVSPILYTGDKVN